MRPDDSADSCTRPGKMRQSRLPFPNIWRAGSGSIRDGNSDFGPMRIWRNSWIPAAPNTAICFILIRSRSCGPISGVTWYCGNSAAYMPISMPKRWQTSRRCSNSEVPIFAYEPRSHAALEFIRRRGFINIVSNAVILSPAGHPFWDHLLRLMHRCRSAGDPLDATGPIVLTAAVEQAPAAAAPRSCLRMYFARSINSACPLIAIDQHWNRLLFIIGLEPVQIRTLWTPLLAPSSPQVTMRDFSAAVAEADRFLSAIDRAIVNAAHRRMGACSLQYRSATPPTASIACSSASSRFAIRATICRLRYWKATAPTIA